MEKQTKSNAGRPKKVIDFDKNDNKFWYKVQSYLEIVGKDWDWLKAKLAEKGKGVEHSAYMNWMNGFRQPDINKVVAIAEILKEQQVNIFSPKQLITEDFELNTDGISCKNNIKEIFIKYSIQTPTFVQITGISKNTVNNILRGTAPSDRTLKKFFKYFKDNKLQIESILDLVYFPTFGEKPFSYIELRGKIKVADVNK